MTAQGPQGPQGDGVSFVLFWVSTPDPKQDK
jgi:hypothetical protein